LKALAWIFWHVARVEDGFVSCIVLGQDQLFDLENWARRLAAPTRDVSTSKEEAGELSDSINIEGLWAYRNAVGRRTREGLQALWPDRWDEPIEIADVRRAIAAGVCGEEVEQFLTGRSRESALYWWGLNHTLMHLGQASMLQGVVRAL
jgi:hypothetical protein